MDKEFVSLISVGVAVLLGAMSPGASFLLATRTALSSAPRASLAVSLGLATGAMLFSIAAMLGVQTVFMLVPWLHTVLSVLGGGYLLWVAFRLIFIRSTPQSASNQTENLSFRSAFCAGLLTQLSNPNTALVFASLFTTVVTVNMSPLLMTLIPLMTFFIDFIWFQIVAKLLSAEKTRNRYLRHKRAVDRTCAGFLALLGIKMMT